MYNLYSYMLRHFHVIIREYYISASLSYTYFPKFNIVIISKGNKTVPEKVATTRTEDGHK